MSTTEVIQRYMGLSNKSMMLDLAVRFPRSLPKSLSQTIIDRTAETFDRELKAVAGVKEVIEDLSIPICVASSSSPQRIRRSLSLTGLIDYFGDHIFSAAQVEHGKPAPDLFLLAAARMLVHPDRCLVIEDSVPGVIAAKTAAMHVFGFTGGSHCSPTHAEKLLAAGADATFQSMKNLPDLLSLFQSPEV